MSSPTNPAAGQGAPTRPPNDAPPAATELIERVGWLIKLRWVAIAGVLISLELTQRILHVPIALLPMYLVLAALAQHNLLLGLAVRQWRSEEGAGELPPVRPRNLALLVALAPVYWLRLALALGAQLRRALTGSFASAPLAPGWRDGALARFLVPDTWRGVQREREIFRAAAVTSTQMTVDLAALAALVHFSGGIENPFIFFLVFHAIIASILLARRATFLHASFAFALACAVGLGELGGVLRHYPLQVLARYDEYRNPLFVSAQLFVLGTTLYLAAYFASTIVTHLRRYERQAAFLARELELRADELEAACTRLGQAERTKSQYMLKVAHELKSPLATIQAMLNVVIEGLVGPIPDKAREIVQRAERRSAELAQATQDLLTLAKAREGHLAAEMLPVDVGALASEVVTDMQSLAEEARLTLTLDLGVTSRLVGEPVALRQMIRNLVSNAIRYSRPGGAVRVRVFEPDTETLQIDVEDTGIGIDPADQVRIFEEFYRTPAAKRHVAGGTGLGLPIVKTVAERHAGQVTLRSTPGTGSCFTVRLSRRLQAWP